MEISEVLRPGFIQMAKKNGYVLIADIKNLPIQMDPENYPDPEAIQQVLKGYNVIKVDALAKARELGDKTGKAVNIVMLGCLSKIGPFAEFPEQLWLQAINEVSPTPAVWAGNYYAFEIGRKTMEKRANDISCYQTMAEDHARKSMGECHPDREFVGMQPSI
jgi:Pyruvate/2-oxoacid:ferredoxin oxidoreductase gamma subunit